jgi:hypothetical protein
VRNWLVMMKLASTCPNFDMGFVWGLLCLHPNTIKSSYYYYYYYSSSSSRCELVRPNSQRLMIRSLLNFTGRWNPISRYALRSWNFQNGCHCHGNREHMSKSLTSLISETAKDLAYILSRVGSIFWQKKIASEWSPFLKWPPTKTAKFQCSLISMKRKLISRSILKWGIGW